jgi:hypothetical protein
MPLNHKSDQEARILQAIEAIHSNISPSIRAAARLRRPSVIFNQSSPWTANASTIPNGKSKAPPEEEALFNELYSWANGDFHLGSLLYAKWLIFFFQRALNSPSTHHSLWAKIGSTNLSIVISSFN